ncbi:MAG: AIR synthase family protein [Anaerolineales bacterium]
MSKFSLDVLNQCVYPYKGSEDPDVILGPSFGEDVSLTRVGNDLLASHVDPIIGAIQDIGWLAVHISCNDIATSGIPPRWILALVLVPGREDDELLEGIMSDIDRAAKDIGVSIIGGHSGYSSGITRPLVSVTALGTASSRTPVRTSGARVGDHILVTKGIALEGTAILASDFSDIARKKGLQEEDIEEAKGFFQEVSVIDEALLLALMGATAMHDVTRGGILETLLEISHLSGVGMEVHSGRIPLPDTVAKFSQAFQFDPLGMISSGTLVAAVGPENLAKAERSLRNKGIPFGDIGEVIEGEGVYIIKEGEKEHHTGIQAEKDELARIWETYPRDGTK